MDSRSNLPVLELLPNFSNLSTVAYKAVTYKRIVYLQSFKITEILKLKLIFIDKKQKQTDTAKMGW